MTRKHRQPTAEELHLWHQVARSVTPIGRAMSEPEVETPTPETGSERAGGRPRPLPPRVTRPVHTPQRPPQSGSIDRRLSGKVARGRLPIDARIDLHGMTQAAAHRRLTTFLHDAQANGGRLALVITGKGRAGTDRPGESERGVLRRMVPQWLGSAELRPFVVGFGEAGRQHGGGGALYVHIRRPRGR